ncbi:MAG: protein kinase [Desulfobacteraceae bacterium]|nr:protein kinase [Desulfobacteraceae bacterium]
MEQQDLYHKFLARLTKAQKRIEQGLGDAGAETIREILAEMERSPFHSTEKEKILLHLQSLADASKANDAVPPSTPEADSSEAAQHFQYGLVLLDGQFWEEAITEFGMAAALQYQPLKCWEYCGDCASKLSRWDDAIRYYNSVYSTEDISSDLKQLILLKITKCSQTNKKENMLAATGARGGSPVAPSDGRTEFFTPTVSSLDSYSVDSMLGRTLTTWRSPRDPDPTGKNRSYRLVNLLQVGTSALIVELEDTESGDRLVGQNLAGELGAALSPEILSRWAERQQSLPGRHLTRVYDLAHADGCFFIVREQMDLSLNDILTAGKAMPIPLAIRLAYQILEGLGDLHLQMGFDGKIHNQFHLDLRPSRILLRKDRPRLKIYNGGLWKQLETAAPEKAHVKNIPLHYLAYRAPEQFRPYLARKRPPFFTDIYLFGCLFYEILTGVPPFKATSREEYEIQHCEQYPSPPKVWRPEIPDVVNDLIVQCLHGDPTKRWRSTTQMSLLIEKAYPHEVAREKDDSYRNFLRDLKLL